MYSFLALLKSKHKKCHTTVRSPQAASSVSRCLEHKPLKLLHLFTVSRLILVCVHIRLHSFCTVMNQLKIIDTYIVNISFNVKFPAFKAKWFKRCLVIWSVVTIGYGKWSRG